MSMTDDSIVILFLVKNCRTKA